MRRPLAGALVLCVAVAARAESPLETAKSQVANLDYAQAKKSLAEAEKAEGYSRDELLELYELAGIVAGSLNDAEGAKAAFLKLLTLDPSHKLKGKLAPRVSTPFFEAKGRVSDKGGLSLAAQAPVVEPGRVTSIGYAVSGDAAGWGTSLVVHLREDGGAWREVFGAPPTLSVPTHAAEVESWAELLTPKRWVLATAGRADAPLVVEAPKPPPVPVAPAPAPVAAPVVAPLPPVAPLVVIAAPPAEPRSRALAYALGGLGVVALGAGALFEVWAMQAMDVLQHSQKNAAGVVNSMTRADALSLARAAHDDSRLAVAGFSAGGALVVAAAVTWALGTPAPAPVSVSVTVAPGPGGFGLVVGGGFP